MKDKLIWTILFRVSGSFSSYKNLKVIGKLYGPGRINAM